ncbi:acetyltransferase [Campylobacterota bacterium]|nr:acetyltransferase [Campylobacterota bacterium]
MVIRKYRSSDCNAIVQLFYDTVHSVNAKDYTNEQLGVWATGSEDVEEWNAKFLESYAVVAVENGVFIGFGNIENSGYLDMLYVHKDYQRKGVASAICDELEKTTYKNSITTYSSITAKPFFEQRGYRIIKENEIERNGITLKNYLMKKC